MGAGKTAVINTWARLLARFSTLDRDGVFEGAFRTSTDHTRMHFGDSSDGRCADMATGMYGVRTLYNNQQHDVRMLANGLDLIHAPLHLVKVNIETPGLANNADDLCHLVPVVATQQC